MSILLGFVLLYLVQATSGALSGCAIACLGTVKGTPENFCLTAASDPNSVRVPLGLCILSTPCPEMQSSSENVESQVRAFCQSFLDPATLISASGAANIGIPVKRDDRLIVGWSLHAACLILFGPAFVWFRNERIIRYRHWSMGMVAATGLVTYIGLIVFFYKLVENPSNISLNKVRVYVSLIQVTFHLTIPAFDALIILYPFCKKNATDVVYEQFQISRDKAQKLRSALQRQLPVIETSHYTSVTPISTSPEQLNDQVKRLRRVNYWAQEQRAWVYYALCGLPGWIFVTWILSSKWESPEFPTYVVWLNVYQVFFPIALLLALKVPWAMSDNFGIKWQSIASSILLMIDYLWIAINYYYPSQKVHETLVWLTFFSPFFLLSFILVLPTCIAVLPSYRDKVHFATPTRDWFLRRSKSNAKARWLVNSGWTNTQSNGASMGAVPLRDISSKHGVSSEQVKGGDREKVRPGEPMGWSGPPPGGPSLFHTTSRDGGTMSRTRRATSELEAALGNATSLRQLTKFAAHEFCVENLLFLAAAMDYQVRASSTTGSGTDTESRSKWAERIIFDFVRTGSVNEVNLPSSIRYRCEESFSIAKQHVEPLDPDLFLEAVEHVKYMLATDIMPRYKRSRFYVEPGSRV
ncbi:hypothetical protein SpCBS45565_g07650 [Spizellomyces sp. 'palustris']|nr:hypothetical protein SpCBS45565_g07650 [Spizellomyces sp. 'palustris']